MLFQIRVSRFYKTKYTRGWKMKVKIKLDKKLINEGITKRECKVHTINQGGDG